MYPVKFYEVGMSEKVHVAKSAEEFRDTVLKIVSESKLKKADSVSGRAFIWFALAYILWFALAYILYFAARF